VSVRVALFIVLMVAPVAIFAQSRDSTIAGSTLRVQVLAASDRSPIEGAEVTIRSAGKRAFADSAGTASLAGLSAGEQIVEVRSIGYLPSAAPLTLMVTHSWRRGIC